MTRWQSFWFWLFILIACVMYAFCGRADPIQITASITIVEAADPSIDDGTRITQTIDGVVNY